MHATDTTDWLKILLKISIKNSGTALLLNFVKKIQSLIRSKALLRSIKQEYTELFAALYALMVSLSKALAKIVEVFSRYPN